MEPGGLGILNFIYNVLSHSGPLMERRQNRRPRRLKNQVYGPRQAPKNYALIWGLLLPDEVERAGAGTV